MSDVDLQKLKKLFQEKRYSEVVFEIEASTTEKNRSSSEEDINDDDDNESSGGGAENVRIDISGN